MTLPPYAVDFRGKPACPCQVAWLPVFEAEAQRRGFLRGPLPLSQIIGGAKTSGNTHLLGGADDTYPLDRVTDVGGYVWLSRQMGADATWHRWFNWDGKKGVEHVHRVLTNCPHCATTAAYQTAAVRGGFNGLGHLGHGAPDDGPRPLSGRTWQEGIDWAEEQDMTPEQEDRIVARMTAAVVKALTEGKPNGSDLSRDQLWKQTQGAADETRDLLKAQGKGGSGAAK